MTRKDIKLLSLTRVKAEVYLSCFFFLSHSFLLIVLLLLLRFNLPPTQRRWWRGGERRGAAALLLRLHHALPHRLLEGSVRLRPSHRVLERLGLLHRLHITYRRPHRSHGRSGISLRLHDRTERLGDGCGVCSAGNISARWGWVGKSLIIWL